MGWGPKETEALKRLLAEGKSFGVIEQDHGAEVGWRSRCAIAGKAQRLGLHAQNADTKTRRNRRLSDGQVRQIRESRQPYTTGRKMGLNSASVYQILQGETYKDVPSL